MNIKKIKDTVCVRLSQRYFLALMCCCGMALTTMNRLNFNLLMKQMIYTDRLHEKRPACPPVEASPNYTTGVEEFMWGTKMKLYIMGGFSTGFFLGRLPAGLSTDRFGAKTLFGYSVFIPAICTVLTPACARTSPYAMLGNRMLTGIFSSAQIPTVAWFAVRWFPPKDMGLMLAIVCLGFPMGSILRFHFANLLGEVHNNWATMFHTVGAISVVWVYFWQALIWDDPFEHPYIKIRELEFLADNIPMYANDTELEPGWFWPWKAMFTSCSLWTLMSAYVGFSWFHNYAVVIIPNLYFPEVHKYDFSEHTTIGGFLYLLMATTMLVAGVVSDKLINARYFNVTHMTKIYYTLSSILGSMFFLGLTHSRCHLTTIFVYYMAAIACMGIGYNSLISACVNMAPNFAATTVALHSLLGTMTLPPQTLLMDIITSNATLSEWKTTAYLNAAVCIFTTAIFLKKGSCHLKDWNQPKPKKAREVDYEGLEVPKENTKASKPVERGRAIPSTLVDPEIGEQPSVVKSQSLLEQNINLESLSQRRVAEIKSNHSFNRKKPSRSKIKK